MNQHMGSPALVAGDNTGTITRGNLSFSDGERGMTTGQVLAGQLEGTRTWTLKLIADLNGDEWAIQPGAGLAHPLWLCGHLAVAQHSLIHQRCLGLPFLDDGFAAAFPIGGDVRPVADGGYPAVGDILGVMGEVHAKTLEAVRGMNDALLAEKLPSPDGKPHPFFDDKLGAVSHCDRHEAFHAGQLALIRRLLGKPFLR